MQNPKYLPHCLPPHDPQPHHRPAHTQARLPRFWRGESSTTLPTKSQTQRALHPPKPSKMTTQSGRQRLDAGYCGACWSEHLVEQDTTTPAARPPPLPLPHWLPPLPPSPRKKTKTTPHQLRVCRPAWCGGLSQKHHLHPTACVKPSKHDGCNATDTNRQACHAGGPPCYGLHLSPLPTKATRTRARTNSPPLQQPFGKQTTLRTSPACVPPCRVPQG